MEFLTQGKESVQVWSTEAFGPDGSREPLVTLPPVFETTDRSAPSARFSPDRKSVACLGMDGRVRLYDTSKGYEGMKVRVFPEEGRAAAVRWFNFSPQGSYLVMWERYDANAEKQENLSVWSTETGDQLVAFILKQLKANVLQWNADESMMFRRVTNELLCYPG